MERVQSSYRFSHGRGVGGVYVSLAIRDACRRGDQPPPIHICVIIICILFSTSFPFHIEGGLNYVFVTYVLHAKAIDHSAPPHSGTIERANKFPRLVDSIDNYISCAHR